MVAKMGADKLFNKRRVGRKKRDEAIREPRKTPWLILCEGGETEPNYFRGLIKHLIAENGGEIDAVFGDGGKNTKSLIESTESYFDVHEKAIHNKKIRYENEQIIFVFDRDSFPDEHFNTAIEMANARYPGCTVAWSNESFELWLRLHFEYANTSQTRHQHNDKLTEIFRNHNVFTDKQTYKKHGKNSKDIFGIIKNIGGSYDRAIRYAKKLATDEDLSSPAKVNPCTMVFEAVEKLINESKRPN